MRLLVLFIVLFVIPYFLGFQGFLICTPVYLVSLAFWVAFTKGSPAELEDFSLLTPVDNPAYFD